jgi:hypothetical protein
MSVVGFDLGNESSIVVVAHRRIIDTVQVFLGFIVLLIRSPACISSFSGQHLIKLNGLIVLIFLE